MTPEREQQLVDEVAYWKREHELLRQKLDLVLRKLFGKSSETLDPAQLELLLGEPPGKTPASPPRDDAPEEASASSVAKMSAGRVASVSRIICRWWRKCCCPSP